MFAPTTVVDLTSLLKVDCFGASAAAPPLPFLALAPAANVLEDPNPPVTGRFLNDLMQFIAISPS
ncbi:hypothetical protein HanIR_Chr14g0706221 [Helianthus annuus]|nr:hypothetical protein HanIR_Chr14g0706221 [Helianthus annuus]